MAQEITYLPEKKFTEDEVRALFESIDWESAAYPELVVKALKNSDAVFSARCEGKLVGIINGISDGAMCVYCHYLAVHADFQGAGVGGKLLDMFLEHYKDIPTKVLIASAKSEVFYKRKGFFTLKSGLAMYHSNIICED